MTVVNNCSSPFGAFMRRVGSAIRRSTPCIPACESSQTWPTLLAVKQRWGGRFHRRAGSSAQLIGFGINLPAKRILDGEKLLMAAA